MEIDIYANDSGIIIGATGVDEIIQNVRMIMATRKGSVPLDRDFGLDHTFLDQPLPLAMALARAEVFEAIEKYEPRVKVLKVEFVEQENIETADGKLFPKVRVQIL